MGSELDNQPNSVSLERVLQRALLALYNPAELAHSPLIGLLRLAGSQNPAQSLYKTLTETVEAMKPAQPMSQQSPIWRNYRILLHRYVQQVSQREVAVSLGFSVRQLQRHEQAALLAYAGFIKDRFQLSDALDAPQASDPAPAGDEPLSSQDTTFEELERLRESFSAEAVDVIEILRAAIETVAPLLAQVGARVDNQVLPNLPPAAVQTISLRQAFVILLSAARHAPGGVASISVSYAEEQINLVLTITPGPGGAPELAPAAREDLALASQLVTLSGGRLALEEQAGCLPVVRLLLPTARKAPVLFIDDNADALHLFQRYLQGSRYQFFGSTDPEQVVSLALEYEVAVVVLDVMLPGVDGLEVLGRLREHPATRQIPVIISTILPYEQLALTIGATGFLRKPVSQKDLLAALDRLSNR